ncbi:MAG: thermonuclease family protein [Azospirillaceae bacterium]|nr:thermonuclease family protein [Azospirillaceae bacterium]
MPPWIGLGSIGAAIAAVSSRDVPQRGADGVVNAVPDGDTVVLSDGRLIRLAGIEAPQRGRRPPGGADAQPFAAEAQAVLDTTVRGRHVVPWFDRERTDRWGRVVADLQLDDGSWLADVILAAGAARVVPTAESRSGAARARLRAMIAVEAAARAARRGLWAVDFYQVRSPDNPGPPGSFQLIEGRVTDIATRRGQWSLRLGIGDAGVVVGLTASVRRALRAVGRDAAALLGQRVRLRGWVVDRGVPTIEIAVPEQIEVVE